MSTQILKKKNKNILIGFLEMSKKKEIWNCKREAINVDRSQNDQGRIETLYFY